MASDLFNNNTNNYANPGFAPCISNPDSNSLQFVKNGIGIVSGNEIISKIDFSSLSIPVSAWSQQVRVINPGEVTFIQGLDKVLLQKQQGFTMPTLTSSDSDLNKYFIEIDLSINYYSSFSYKGVDVDTSANYSSSIAVDDAVTLDLYDKGISVTSTFTDDAIYFNGTVAGYDFSVTNVTITLIDASQNSESPFTPNIINGVRYPIVYDLSIDDDLTIAAAKHLATASQGIILKNIFPAEYNSTTISTYDKWLYLNHASNTVTSYVPIDLTFLRDSSADYLVIFDGSALVDYFGASYGNPDTIFDIDVANISTASSVVVSDVSVSDSSTIIGSGFTANNITVQDSSITLSTIVDSSILDSSVGTSGITNSTMQNGLLLDSSTVLLKAKDVTITGGIHSDLVADGDGTTIISGARIKSGSTIGDYIISDVSVYDVSAGTIFRDASINDIIIEDVSAMVLHTFYNVNINTASIYDSAFIDSSLWITNITTVYINSSIIAANTILADASIRNSIIYNDSSISTSFIQDTSIIESYVYNNAGQALENVDVSGGTIANTSVTFGTMVGTRVLDSSLYGLLINQDASIDNSIIENSWINAYRLLASTDASGNMTYEYIINDPTLDIDSSSWRVNISKTPIWDVSINNATIRDSSIYNSYIQDSSLINCTVYNTDIDRSTFEDCTTVMIDASIVVACDLDTDTSTYYRKVTKTLDIGLNGASTDTVMSAGDYLEYVTNNSLWNKVGDLYMWTAAPDSGIYNEVNLINGFYLFNPHTFPISAEYLVIV